MMIVLLAGVTLHGSGSVGWAAGSEQDAKAAPPETGPVGRKPKTEPAEIVEAFEGRSVLTPKGTLVIQPSLEYSHSSSNRVLVEGFTILPAITIGLIDARRVDRDTLTANLTFRCGLTRRLEFETSIPFVWRSVNTVDRQLEIDATQDEIVNLDSAGVGDLAFGLRYQLNRGLGNGPIKTGNLRIKTHSGTGPFEVPTDVTGFQTELPTGSGFWGIEAGLTTIMPSDPAVFYSNLSYMWSPSRRFSEVGKIDPGDSVAFSLGMGIALNERASFSLGYEHHVVGKSKQNGGVIKGSEILHVGSLLLGASYRRQDERRLNLSISAGLTEDAPDVRLVLRMPFSFAPAK